MLCLACLDHPTTWMSHVEPIDYEMSWFASNYSHCKNQNDSIRCWSDNVILLCCMCVLDPNKPSSHWLNVVCLEPIIGLCCFTSPANTIYICPPIALGWYWFNEDNRTWIVLYVIEPLYVQSVLNQDNLTWKELKHIDPRSAWGLFN